MSAERLREAARVLRERAEAATPGPWWIPAEDWAVVASGSDSVLHGFFDDQCQSCGEKIIDDAEVAISAEDRTYIATMHPGVGLALADWLEWTSVVVENDVTFGRVHVEKAVAVADLILGDPS